MVTTPTQLAKRALVSVLLALATAYQVVLDINRESDDSSVKRAFRKVCLKVHPDKGGSTEDFKRLSAAHTAWEKGSGPRSDAAGEGSGSHRGPQSQGGHSRSSQSQRRRQGKAKGRGRGKGTGRERCALKKSAAP